MNVRKEVYGASTLHGSPPSSGPNDAHSDTNTLKRRSNLWAKLSASKFPYRFRVLYGWILECRSFYHRIRLAAKRGDVCQPQMGHRWETSALGHLIPNRRTQARIQDMQQALSLHPWMSPEDWHIFLIGWDAGSEYSAHSDHADILGRSIC
jgi:hypothetical protein